MPKEITHWLVSMKTAEALRGTPMGNAALSNQNVLKLGAIFPDILFHLPNDSVNSQCRDIAYSLHGTKGEDTYDLIRQIITAMRGSPYRQQLLAFLLGVATHIQTDVVFHPMVYYLTGNYEHVEPSKRSEAIQQHRRFECLMDIYFCGGSRHVKEHTVKAILKDTELPLPQLSELLPRGNARHENLPDMNIVMMRALKNLRIIQGLYTSRTLTRILYKIAPFLSGVAREFIALFYDPQLDRLISRVSGTLHYRNPVTGETKNASLSGLMEEAVKQSSHLARRIEETMAADVIRGFSERGPSLCYGVVGANANHAIYFAEKPFFDQRTLDSIKGSSLQGKVN